MSRGRIVGLLLLQVVCTAGCAMGGRLYSTVRCGYPHIKGDEFRFAAFEPRDQRSAYQAWNKAPEMGGHLGYGDYVGRRGKILDVFIADAADPEVGFRKAVLSNCERVYSRAARNSPLKFGIWMDKDVERAQARVGDFVWIDLLRLRNPEGPPTLYLVDSNLAVPAPLRHGERLEVLDVVLDVVPHAFSYGDFHLRVSRKSGEQGLFPFNRAYLLDEDPMGLDAPESFRSAVDRQEVVLGMTTGQAYFVLGEPLGQTITSSYLGMFVTSEYESQRLYFKDGILEKVEHK